MSTTQANVETNKRARPEEKEEQQSPKKAKVEQKDTPVAEQPAEENAPAAENETPAVEDDSPAAENETPEVEKESPVAEDEQPAEDAPFAKDEKPEEEEKKADEEEDMRTKLSMDELSARPGYSALVREFLHALYVAGISKSRAVRSRVVVRKSKLSYEQLREVERLDIEQISLIRVERVKSDKHTPKHLSKLPDLDFDKPLRAFLLWNEETGFIRCRVCN